MKIFLWGSVDSDGPLATSTVYYSIARTKESTVFDGLLSSKNRIFRCWTRQCGSSIAFLSGLEI